MSGRERAKRIEMQKIGPLEIAVAVAQAWSRDVPGVERPEAERNYRAMSAQAF
jgi:hypothetical protein